jgi:hypothetical protein
MHKLHTSSNTYSFQNQNPFVICHRRSQIVCDMSDRLVSVADCVTIQYEPGLTEICHFGTLCTGKYDEGVNVRTF